MVLEGGMNGEPISPPIIAPIWISLLLSTNEIPHSLIQNVNEIVWLWVIKHYSRQFELVGKSVVFLSAGANIELRMMPSPRNPTPMPELSGLPCHRQEGQSTIELGSIRPEISTNLLKLLIDAWLLGPDTIENGSGAGVFELVAPDQFFANVFTRLLIMI